MGKVRRRQPEQLKSLAARARGRETLVAAVLDT